MVPNILSIAGSDPSGGAGVQADVRVCTALGCYGMAAIAALTVQNTDGVSNVTPVPPALLEDQVRAVFDDIDVHAVKIGMLGSVKNVRVIASILRDYKPAHIVLDPVLMASKGAVLLEEEALGVLREELLPLASVVTPNISEAEKLTRKAVLDLEAGAQAMLDIGAHAVVLKGGHLKGETSPDVLAYADQVVTMEGARIATANTHGTGCTFSTALACFLARGLGLEDAALAAKNYVRSALEGADQLNVGQGCGPLHHMVQIRRS